MQRTVDHFHRARIRSPLRRHLQSCLAEEIPTLRESYFCAVFLSKIRVGSIVENRVAAGRRGMGRGIHCGYCGILRGRRVSRHV